MSKVKQYIPCIKEFPFPKHLNFNIEHYNGLFKERYVSYKAYGEVVIFIHETIPQKIVTHNSPLQAVAATVNRGMEVTVVSVYHSRSPEINEHLLINRSISAVT